MAWVRPKPTVRPASDVDATIHNVLYGARSNVNAASTIEPVPTSITPRAPISRSSRPCQRGDDCSKDTQWEEVETGDQRRSGEALFGLRWRSDQHRHEHEDGEGTEPDGEGDRAGEHDRPFTEQLQVDQRVRGA